MENNLFGAIEAGGTKFVCLVGSDPDHIEAQTRIETTTPEETLNKVIAFFKPFITKRIIEGIGMGSFGPFDLNLGSSTYGFITNTPKPGWSNTNITGILRQELNVKIAIDTDVNAAARGEFRWGASARCDPSLYLTIGTGIGGGYIINGEPLQGLLTLEMGHIRIRHDLDLDPFPGSCPFHGDCFEGLASGPALYKRFDGRGETLLDDHPYWEIEAGYIASALVNYILILSPKIIILGGGIMQRSFLFPLVRQKVLDELNGYVQSSVLLDHISEYIVPPGLGDRSGVLGALALSQLATG